MKKRILSCLMALALCLTLLPTAALAEETEGTAQTSPAVEESTDPANGEAKQESQPAETKQESQPAETKQENQSAAPEQENQPAEAKREGQSAEQEEQQEDSASKQAVAAVQAMIDALPDAAELDGMDDEDAMAVYEAFQAACDAYYDLTEEQQAQLKNTEKLAALSERFSQSAALAVETHEHYLCGGTKCNGEGHALEDEKTTFKPWNKDATTNGGAYYLTSDIGGFTVHSGVKLTLCLNGYNITSNGVQNEDVITVESGATLTLCDCKRGGKTGYGTIGHTRPDQYNGSGVTVENGTFNMYGGKIANNTVGNPDFNKSNGYGGGVLVFNKGIFNMIGGEITGNRAKYGGGVSVGTAYGLHDNTAEDIGGTFNMTGGKISGNFCASKGGGVYACVSSKLYFTVSGSARITDNYTGNYLSSVPEEGTANNVYLEKYTDDNTGETIMATIEVGTLDSTASIGVTTADAGQTVATGVSEAAAKCFTCDDSSKYRLIYNSGERTLTMATAAHSAHPICGDVNCTNNDHALPQGSSWKSVSSLSSVTSKGYYYLTKDVEINGTWQAPNGAYLCLNGYKIIETDNVDAITVNNGNIFTLCDCVGTGKITHAEGKTGRGVKVQGTFNLYGGAITGNRCSTSGNYGSGVYVDSGARFNMHGGSITGNENTVSRYGYGAGVYVSNGTFNMTGGSITKNTATYGAGVWTNVSFTVSGAAKIIDNSKDNAASNVYLAGDNQPITIGEGGLAASAKIGVTTGHEDKIESGKYVTVATGAEGSCTEDNFFADKGEPYGIKVEKGTDANSVNVNLYNGLPHVHYLCNGKDESGKDKCTGIGNHTEKGGAVTFEPWTRDNSLPEEEGNWYLTKDVEITKTWTKNDGVVLCLNGYSITLKTSGTTTDAVYAGTTAGATSTLTICDCNGSGNGNGKITGSSRYGVHVWDFATFNLYGGTITGNATGVYNDYIFNMYGGAISQNRNRGVKNASNFHMYDGSITGNTANGLDGGGVYGGWFYMEGGEITGNTSTSKGGNGGKGGGVYTTKSEGFTVSGNVKITGNTADDKENNVHLGKSSWRIAVRDPLGENARIGVTTADEVAANSYVTIAKGEISTSSAHRYTLTANDAEHFVSDAGYTRKFNDDSVVFTNGDLHTHPICGKTCADEKHTDKIWQGVSRLDDITEAGYYYLTKDVTVIGKAWKPVNGVVLCLNGNSIVAAGSFDAISVDTGVTFTLTDCKPEGTAGQITHSFDGDGKRYISRGVDVSGTFNLYDGSIAGNDTGRKANPGGGVAVADSGTFHMYGGKITGNTALSGGGVDLSGGTFNMTGGEITGNTAYGTETNGGGGVRVGSGCTFTMSGGKISGNTTDGGGGGVHVYTRGKFTMSGDAVISGNTAAGSGGGVCVSESGTFTMEGGTIGGTDNGNTAYGRGGGGVYVYNGTFKMKNGTISGNSTDDSKGGDGNGGGVYVQGSAGSFNMSGGTINVNTAKRSGGGVFVKGANSSFIMGGSAAISGNTAESKGGGVYMESAIGAFTMNGGTISGNKATGLNGYGGGVYVASNDDESSKFTMYSGTISGNTASDYGGGVYVYSTTELGGTFTMNGGEITGNNGTHDGGGVYVGQKAKMTVSGGARIEDNWKNGTLNEESGVYEKGDKGSANNLYLYNVAIGTLAGTAHIGITTAKTPTAGDPVQFATGATGDLDYTTIFTPDAADQGYVVNKDGSGNLFLNAHRHNWTYALKESTTDTITTTCTADGCANSDGGSVKISASNAAYDGRAKAATVKAIGDWKGDAVDSIAVKYTGREGTVYDSSDAPTNAGKYTASITLGNATASVTYEITKAAPQASDFNITPPETLVYDGNRHGAVVTVKNGITGMGEITATKYYINANGQMDPVKVNRYEVRVDVAEGANYTAATEVTDGSWTFAIDKGTQTVHVPTGKTIVKNGKGVDISGWANVTGVEGGQATGALSYALVGDVPAGVSLTEGKLTVQQIVAKDKVITIKATAAATDDYNEASETFTVTVADKQPVNLSVSMTDWTYGGNANEPQYDAPEGVTATVTYANADGTALSERPANAGSYTVKVQYATDTEIRTGTAAFTISPKPLQQEMLARITGDRYYNGTEQTPDVTVTDGEKTLVKDVDYTVSYSNNVNASTPTSQAVATVTGKGNYEGTISTTFVINPVSLSINGEKRMTATASYGTKVKEIPVSSAEVYYYDSGHHVMIVPGTWKFDGDDMDEIPEVGNTKAYKAVFTPTSGSENYRECSTYIKPSITQAAGSVTAPAAKTGLVYNGEEQALLETPPTSGTGTVLYSQDGTNYTATPPMGREAKTYTVFYMVMGDKNHQNVAAQRISVKIEKLAITVTAENKTSRVGQTLAELTYTHTPELAAGDAFTGTLETNARPDATGEYPITRGTLALNENYTIDFHAGTYTVADKLVQSDFRFESIPSAVSKTYGDPDFSAGAGGAAEGSTVTYESSAPAVATVDSATGKVTIKGAGMAVITARASATEEYDEAAATCTLTVGKKPIAIPTADATVFTYNGTEQTYALAENEAYTITGNKQTNANETGYSVTAALKDTANTQWADGTAVDKTYTFVIGKAVITVKAKDQTAYVGDKAPTLGADSYTVSGLVGEEKLTTQPTVKYVGADGSEITPDMTKTGEVKILAGGAAASDNYTIRYEDGKLTVSARLSGGGGGSSPSTNPVQTEVGKDPDGSVSLSKTSAAKGDKVTITVKPEQHYEVDEVIVRDSKGKQLAVKDNGDGTYTFEMPADKVTVEPTFTWVNPFADVANSAYYVDAVEWMLKREVTQGTTDTTFSPNLNCTRAQIVTFLWRAAGSPEPKGTVGFADVSVGSYYAKAVAWAVENGITGGTGNGLFSPDATCTRAQSAAFLYRAAGSPAVSGSAGFSDVAADAYYAQAVAWAKEHGITDGIGGGRFGSANDCTRAQIAAFLWRLYAEK